MSWIHKQVASILWVEGFTIHSLHVIQNATQIEKIESERHRRRLLKPLSAFPSQASYSVAPFHVNRFPLQLPKRGLFFGPFLHRSRSTQPEPRDSLGDGPGGLRRGLWWGKGRRCSGPSELPTKAHRLHESLYFGKSSRVNYCPCQPFCLAIIWQLLHPLGDCKGWNGFVTKANFSRPKPSIYQIDVNS